MHGPKVSDGRRRRKTFLMAFIDDATRVLPFAAFDFSESTTAFLPVLKSALTRRGLPLRLYVDNGANYRSHQLALVCAKLGIALIHARPWQPAGKGKIERFFRTLRAAWLERLDADATSRPRGAQPQPLGLGRGRVPPIAPSRPRRAHPARAVGARRRKRALPRPRPRPRRPVPLRGQTPRHEGPHREPARATLRGRCHPRGALHHLALRPPGPGVAPPAGPPRRAPRGRSHTPRRLRQYQASLRSKRNFPVKRDRSSWHAQPDDPAPEPRPSPLAMQKLKEKN